LQGILKLHSTDEDFLMKINKAVLSLTLVSGLLALTVAYADQVKDKAKATTRPLVVNGTTISPALIQMIVGSQVAQGQEDNAALQQNVRENLATLLLIAQEASKKGLDKNAEVKNQIELGREQVLARAFQTDYVKSHPVSDADLRAAYEQMKKELGDKEYEVQHVLVAKKDEADAIIKDLKAGGDFDKIAKEKSLDTGTRDKGGKLDWVNPAALDKSFSTAMMKLGKGETSQEAVQSSYGYHVIRVLDIRPLQPPPFEQVKQRIAQAKEQEALSQAIAALRSKAKIEGLQ
jgi:peptidyl-prolyl cis-trans isomerase C